ncbi:MAG: hypothetical protein Kow0092_22200 [Deferrisomatales bacterium]
MAPQGSPPVPVVAAVIRDDRGRVLLARRLPGGPHGGRWEFPGGKVEPGESRTEALGREIREELGVEVRVGKEVARVEHRYPHLVVELIAYRCRIARGEPRAIQCAEWAWVEPARLLDYPLPEADVPIARRLAGG